MYVEYGERRNNERDAAAMMAGNKFMVSHLQRQSQDPALLHHHHPIDPVDHYSVTQQRIPPHSHQHHHHHQPQSSSLSSGKHVKLKPSDLGNSSNAVPAGYNNYYANQQQQPKSAPKPLDYQKLNNHTSGGGGGGSPAGILKNHSGGGHSKRRPLIYELKQYEYFNSNNSSSKPPATVKNTNSVLQQHYSGHNYNINYNLNFTKNQYNILISPPTTTTATRTSGPVPPYDENNHFISSHYQQQQQVYQSQNNARNYKNNNANRQHPHHPLNNYNQYLSNQHEHHSSKHHQHQHYLDEKPPLTEAAVALDGELGKMQREEIIIEHSQLVGDGSGPGIVIHPAAAGAAHPAGQGAAGRQPLLKGKGGLGGGEGKLTAINRSHHFTQIIAALAVSIGPLAAGLGKGYSSPAIASLQELQIRGRGNYTAFSVNDQQASWIASLSLLGALFGGMFGGVAMQYGRKRVLALMSLPFSLSWILTVFAKSVETMFFTAFIGGFCCAIVSTVTQVYISEISSPDIRGFLSAIQKIAGHMGMLISYLLGAYLDWRQLAMLVSVAPIMLFISVIYIPETPSFLVLRGCDDEAHRSLQWLRGPHKNVEIELDTIRSNVRTSRINLLNRMSSVATTTTTTVSSSGQPVPTQQQQQPQSASSQLSGFVRSWHLPRISFDAVVSNVKAVMRNARLVKPVSITCGLMIFQRFTGANSFNFYAVSIFSKTFAGMNPHGAAIAVGFVQLLASMLSGLLIDTVGRIPLLIVSSVFMSLALASFGSFVYYGHTNKLLATANFDLDAPVGNNDWIPLLCVLVFTVAFSLGISPISWLLVGELFPLEYRGIGSSIATSFSYFCAFLGVKTFMDFNAWFGLHGTFWLYACISCAGLFFVIMVVPETKGRDLEEMDPKYVRTLTINR